MRVNLIATVTTNTIAINQAKRVKLYANIYGVYPKEIKALQQDYAELWEPLNGLLKKLA